MKIIIFCFSVIVSILFSCQEKDGNAGSLGNKVLDSANLLTVDQRLELQKSIDKLENDVGSQIAIVIVDSLGKRQINEASLAVATKLNLGRQKYADGVLIFVALRDRKVRIEVGSGLERIIRDEIAGRINRNKMGPRFRKQEYYEGLSAAVDEISELIRTNRQLIGKR